MGRIQKCSGSYSRRSLFTPMSAIQPSLVRNVRTSKAPSLLRVCRMVIPATVSKFALSTEVELADTLDAYNTEFNTLYALK